MVNPDMLGYGAPHYAEIDPPLVCGSLQFQLTALRPKLANVVDKGYEVLVLLQQSLCPGPQGCTSHESLVLLRMMIWQILFLLARGV